MIRVLLVVPPFAAINRPSLACHQLQACGRAAGFEVDVRYANLQLAGAIGEARYQAVCYWGDHNHLGELLFAPKAYGVEPRIGSAILSQATHPNFAAVLGTTIGDEAYLDLVGECSRFVAVIAPRIVAEGYEVIGCSSTFTQTAPSLALLGAVKALSPRTIAIMGGGNCEGVMAEGILGLAPWLDHVFSGESEVSFVEFIEGLANGAAPAAHSVIRGEPWQDLDSLPLPDFSQYYEQLQRFLPDSGHFPAESIPLPYQSSRGCWWGMKHHCSFCGLNGENRVFRERSGDKVLQDLKLLAARHPVGQIYMADNIMPYSYFREFIPALGRRELPGISIFYEQKANLSLDKVVALMNAGITYIQPGIESLSTPVLLLLNKGITASRNLKLLRYARSVGMRLGWAVLYAVPGDKAEWYRAMNELLSRIHHLYPPATASFIHIDRFSPYFMRPQDHGIRNIRPQVEYHDYLPAHAAIDKIAYHFWGDYESGSAANPEIVDALSDEIAAWREQWSRTDLDPPVLLVEDLPGGRLALFDTRDLSGPGAQFIDADRARIVLAGASRYLPEDDLHRWAIEGAYCMPLDGALAPLAVATPDLLARFEAKEA